MKMMEYYKTLGVTQEATQQEIKKAYRKLSIKFHPDKNNGDVFFENMFKQIQEAYEVLGSVSTRTAYDNSLDEDAYGSTHSYDGSPVIEYFTVDKAFFYSGDKVQLSWNTHNATAVEIKPFGVVNTFGSKVFRLNNVTQQFIYVELIATNTNVATSVSATLTLENSGYKTSSLQEYNTERFWSTKGRLRRTKYGVRMLLLSIVCVVLLVVSQDANTAIEALCHIIVILCWMYISIQTIKRLHDIDKSGWWLLIFLIPYVNLIFGMYVLFAKGTVGENTYGFDPKN